MSVLQVQHLPPPPPPPGRVSVTFDCGCEPADLMPFRRPVATNLYFDSNIRQQAVTPQYDVVGVRLTSRLSSCGIHIHCRPASRLNMLSTSCLCLECSAPAAREVGGAAIVPWSPAWHVVRLSVWHCQRQPECVCDRSVTCYVARDRTQLPPPAGKNEAEVADDCGRPRRQHLCGVCSRTDGRPSHVFQEIAESYNETDMLSPPSIRHFFTNILSSFQCSLNRTTPSDSVNSGHSCGAALCLDVDSLLLAVGDNSSLGLKGEQFVQAAMVLLYFLPKKPFACHDTIHIPAGNNTVEEVRRNLSAIISAHISQAGVSHRYRSVYRTGIAGTEKMIRAFGAAIVFIGVGTGSARSPTAPPSPGEKRKCQPLLKTQVGWEMSTSTQDTAHKDDGDHHDHKHEHDNHSDNSTSIIKVKCLSGDSVAHYLGVEDEADVPAAEYLESVSGVILYQMSQAVSWPHPQLTALTIHGPQCLRPLQCSRSPDGRPWGSWSHPPPP
ncbi:hypothetical protein C0Q70_04341 [Pomacea canaliculata]|uniref:Uncharacterized protein n=1 Tax=Pomacea canaliculata TaxID=400727 RepID=A0A2T7PV94_POMCA|nr:hypothetical protein C0Q70_04341 [Pomacea canaliculata]